MVGIPWVGNVLHAESILQEVFIEKVVQDGLNLKLVDNFVTESEVVSKIGQSDASLLHQGHKLIWMDLIQDILINLLTRRLSDDILLCDNDQQNPSSGFVLDEDPKLGRGLSGLRNLVDLFQNLD